MSVICSQSVAVNWRDVLAVARFCSNDVSRFDLWGVRVEVTPTRDVDWPARLVATDGRRLAVLQTFVRSEHSWSFRMPTSFTIPLPILKKLRKPGKGSAAAWTECRFELVQPPDEPKEPGSEEMVTPDPRIENMMLWAPWDMVRCSMREVPQEYPEWAGLIPTGPYRPAKNVKIHAGSLADFSEAVASIHSDGDATVALCRGDLGGEEEANQVLVVQTQEPRFFGVIMPSHAEMESVWDLPLWVAAKRY